MGQSMRQSGAEHGEIEAEHQVEWGGASGRVGRSMRHSGAEHGESEAENGVASRRS